MGKTCNPHRLHASTHPLVQDALLKLRNVETGPEQFRALTARLALLLAMEATHNLCVTPTFVTTPMQVTANGRRLRDKIGLFPILRAGLEMANPILKTLLPGATTWHIGLYRDEQTLQPVEYYNRLPYPLPINRAFVLDPMLATGRSAVATIAILKKHGVDGITFIGILAAPEGVELLTETYPDVDIHLAAVDERLNDIGYIIPGLGDAGDRQFGTGGEGP